MATNNLIIKSLGDKELSSGRGTPDHLAPIGSLYTDTMTGKIYISVGLNSSGWELLQTASFGELYLSSNATITTISSANTWVSTSNLGWDFGSSNGFTQTGTSSLLVGSNKGGKYLVIAGGTLQFSVASAIYDLGVSINELNPTNGNFQSTIVPAANYQKTINVSSYIDVLPGDNISIVLRCTTATNIVLRHSTLVLIKVF